MPDGRRLSSMIVSDEREVRDAAVRDTDRIAYGKVVCDYLTWWHTNRAFNGHAFLHTRELALEKSSGLLCVLDTIESKGEVAAAFGPVWHVQHVLAKRAGLPVPDGLSGQVRWQDRRLEAAARLDRDGRPGWNKTE
jgi:hypothetical protein